MMKNRIFRRNERNRRKLAFSISTGPSPETVNADKKEKTSGARSNQILPVTIRPGLKSGPLYGNLKRNPDVLRELKQNTNRR